MTRLKAFLNALSDSYPSEVAICSTESSVCCKRSQANSIRHWVIQAAGAIPTVWLKCCANAERDIPTCVASVSTVQPCPGGIVHTGYRRAQLFIAESKEPASAGSCAVIGVQSQGLYDQHKSQLLHDKLAARLRAAHFLSNPFKCPIHCLFIRVSCV